MSLAHYEQQFAHLNINRSQGHGSPHKMCLLLAVIDLIGNGHITQNRLYFDQALKTAFTQHFNQHRHEGDRDNPHLPFFHLKSEPFWHHHVIVGQEASYAALSTASGPGVIEQHIRYASLDEALFELLKNSFAREYLKQALESTLDRAELRAVLTQSKGWDWLECELTVQSYFSMLEKKLRGESYSKADYRRRLLPQLNNRSDAAIEFKHQNISAILVERGFPYIAGYKPAFNYQHMLKDVVEITLIDTFQGLVAESETFIESPPPESASIDWGSILEDPPEHAEFPQRRPEKTFNPRHYNFAEREYANRRLGERGESFVLEYERQRMQRAGRSDLVNEIEWTSQQRGDGTGYDIRSFIPERDQELFIEVKATNSGKYQPFYITENELAFANQCPDQYALYRVFQFKSDPKLFALYGKLDEHVHLLPSVYRATP